jgi:archaemetzincin
VRLWVILIVACVACSDDKTRAPDAVKPATAKKQPAPAKYREDRHADIGDTSKLLPPVQRMLDPIDHFEPPPPPRPGDWMYEHREKKQSFDAFIRSKPNVPYPGKAVIYLLPLGEFPAHAVALDAVAKIVHAYFTLEVKLLPAVPLADVVAKRRINGGTKKTQLLAGDVLTWLKGRLPADAFGLMAITMEDLYPDETWNYVFGMASFEDRVGVQSFARQDPAFFGEKREAGWEKLALRRATWTVVHEVSHMFGLHHCQYWRCVVAGSNNQDEADRSLLHACPVCMHKLWWSIEFDPVARETELARTLRAYGIDDEAAWTERRLAWIRDGKR